MFETLLKVATGLALDVSKKDIIKAVGDFQYGALMAAGADKMIYNLRSLASARPDHVFIATDIKNAFGAVAWHKALHALITHPPLLAPIMTLFWKQPHTLNFSFLENRTNSLSHKERSRANAYPQQRFAFSSVPSSINYSFLGNTIR